MRALLTAIVMLCSLACAFAGDATTHSHWAFQPVAEVAPPDVAGFDHPIDRFVRSGHPGSAPQADRRTLIRRMTFDLTGLPPDPDRVAAFVADERPDAIDRLIDELLASPRYGERWGRYWLDLARYADTAGENSDYPIPEAYRYRDYVIDAFNQDKPYDRFIHEQLAGDILAREERGKRYEERVVATGFIAQSKRFGTHKLEDMHLIIEDTLQTMGETFMGMTLRCARCHEHKFDPISMEEYYSLYSFFAHTAYPFPGGEEVKAPSEFVPIVSPGELAEQDTAWRKQHAEKISSLDAAIERARSESPEGKKLAELNAQEEPQPDAIKQAQKALDAVVKKAQQARDAFLKQLPSRTVGLAYAVREGKPVQTRVHKLGNPKSLGDPVSRGVPRTLDPHPELDIAEGTSGRLELARWLTSPGHPLTARVMVNRIWQHHFGRGIVATPSDFGLQGQPPSHPELLDWLAREFIRREWSIKAMHRLIMRSQVYQLASTPLKDDPDNIQYTRFDRRRLDAEAIRDNLLAVSGQLDLARPGPHPFPDKATWKFTAHHQFKAVYPSKHRSVFLMVQRLHPHPYLSMFDGPNTNLSTGQRGDSTVAMQALFMANSAFVHEAADHFAKRLLAAASDDEARLLRAYTLAFARHPTPAETDRTLKFLEEYRTLLAAEKTPEAERDGQAWSSLCRSLLAANEFVYVD